VNIPASTATFDISNNTGSNASVLPDTTFPVTTPVGLTDLGLTVDLSDGSTEHFGPSDFTLALDGLSFNGPTIPIGGVSPLPTEAILTGMFNTTSITLSDGSTDTISPSFTATILPSAPPDLSDADLAVINATTSSPSAPEPSFRGLFGVGALGLLLVWGVRSRSNFRRLRTILRNQATMAVLVATGLLAAHTVSAAPVSVHLNGATTPDTGVAGVSFVNVIGSGFPTGHGTLPPANATISFALTCGGAVVASTSPDSIINVIGSSYRLHVQLPATLSTANYFASVSGTTSDGTTYASTNCSEVSVTHTNPTLSACVPGSSLGIVSPPKGPASVFAFVPGNPATGEGVCVANDTNVYHISASNTVKTLTSSANTTTSFSGGSCHNCGVAMNALTNQAVITIGLSTSPSGSALQTLNLGTDTFSTPFPLANQVSENISIDPTRGYILSPNEAGVYDLVGINSTTGAYTAEFGNGIHKGEFDSAAEDCTTGIALASIEFTQNVFLADLTQATFTPGSPGAWTAPNSITTLAGSFSAGTSGITFAPGTSHLGTVTGEFGGSSFAVLQLPSTSGTGTPALVDYAYVPCITGFNAGTDPHTVSAYTSPNNGKAYTVFASSAPPAELIVADMAAILAAPRETGTHTVIGDTGPGSCLAPGDGLITSISTAPAP
jgi:hypothetical protein